MSTLLVNIAVGTAIFILGIAISVYRLGTRDRLAFTVVAIVAPFVAVIAMLRLFYLFARNRVTVDPCPEGLEEAEKIVALQRQKMFGGALRAASFTASWQMAYERELQKETEKVQRIAERYLSVA